MRGGRGGTRRRSTAVAVMGGVLDPLLGLAPAVTSVAGGAVVLDGLLLGSILGGALFGLGITLVLGRGGVLGVHGVIPGLALGRVLANLLVLLSVHRVEVLAPH